MFFFKLPGFREFSFYKCFYISKLYTTVDYDAHYLQSKTKKTFYPRLSNFYLQLFLKQNLTRNY